jgi:hypothetical protein
MHQAIRSFKQKHDIDKIAGLMMLHYFKWPWCLRDLSENVDELYLVLHYSEGPSPTWWKDVPKLKGCAEIQEDRNWKVQGWYGREGSSYQGEFRDRALRMLDPVRPDLVFFPDEDESFPEPEYLVQDLARLLKSRKSQLSFTRCNFWDSMETVRKDRWIPYSPHVKIYKWRPGLSYLPYVGWNCLHTYGKKKLVAKSAIKHYAYMEREERERRFHHLYREKQDRFKGLLDTPKLVPYTNARKAPRT